MSRPILRLSLDIPNGILKAQEPPIQRFKDQGSGIRDEGLNYRYGDSNPGPVAENHVS